MPVLKFHAQKKPETLGAFSLDFHQNSEIHCENVKLKNPQSTILLDSGNTV